MGLWMGGVMFDGLLAAVSSGVSRDGVPLDLGAPCNLRGAICGLRHAERETGLKPVLRPDRLLERCRALALKPKWLWENGQACPQA